MLVGQEVQKNKKFCDAMICWFGIKFYKKFKNLKIKLIV